MENLHEEIKILKRIKERLDKLMCDRATPVEIRSNSVYECIVKDEHLRRLFRNQTMFNQFLRRQHNNDILKQIIPNYRVDTSTYIHYQWYFFKEINKAVEKGKGVETFGSRLTYKKNDLKVIASDGTKFRSNQEKIIYENLLKCNYLTIEYEFRILINGEKRFVDFKILNRLTEQIYFWEHFGVTNSSEYSDSMTERIAWYKKNDFNSVEDGGTIIFTIYSGWKEFQRDIDSYVKLISSR